jgi:two-component system OmpR family response regulator
MGGLEHRRVDEEPMSDMITIDETPRGYHSLIAKTPRHAYWHRVATAPSVGGAALLSKQRAGRARLDSGLFNPSAWHSATHVVDSRVTGDPSHHTPCILLVEDDHAMRRMVTDYLTEHNFRIASATNIQDATRCLGEAAPDLVLLDLLLGEEDGIDLLREIRSRSDVPVIIMTGHRCGEADRVIGLELGADHYLTKPFNVRELLARIRAVLRRRDADRIASERTSEGGHYRFGGWQLDCNARRLSAHDGVPVALTKGEYALLLAFLERPQAVLSREHLLEATRVHEDVFDRSIDVQILRLRRKLEADPSQPQIIRTERGVGYLFALSVERL